MTLNNGWNGGGRQLPIQPRGAAVRAPPQSQIFGLSDHSVAEAEPKKQWIKDTDSAYVKLSKQGGHSNLLHNDPVEARSRVAQITKPPTPVNTQADWMYDDEYRRLGAASKNSMSTYEFEVSDDAPMVGGQYYGGPDYPAESYDEDPHSTRPELSEAEYARLLARYNERVNQRLEGSDASELRGYDSEVNNSSPGNVPTESNGYRGYAPAEINSSSRGAYDGLSNTNNYGAGDGTGNRGYAAGDNVSNQMSATQVTFKNDHQARLDMGQANRKKQMYGSEISKLLSFDYIKDKDKVTTPPSRGPLKAPPSALNGTVNQPDYRRGSDQPDHRRRLSEMDQRGPVHGDRAPPSQQTGNGPIPGDYIAAQNGRGRRVDSASSYTTEYQEKMAGQNGPREQNGQARRVDSASSYTTEYQEKMAGSGMSNGAGRYNSRPDSGGLRMRSGSVSSIRDTSSATRRQGEDNRPEFFNIAGTPTAPGPPQFGRRKASVELKSEFFTGYSPGESEAGAYNKKRIEPDQRPEFFGMARSASTVDVSSTMQQKQTNEPDIMDTLTGYQVTNDRTSYRRKKMDFDFASTPTGGKRR